MSIEKAIDNLREEMALQHILPEKGLGDRLFLFASTLMPVVNVDLLIRNSKGEFLLIWRDDTHCGTGWHIPGGCVRFRESVLERAKKTAVCEFGHAVKLDPGIVHVFEIFSEEDRSIGDQNERAHFITLVMTGQMPDDFVITAQSARPMEEGYMQWFTELPDQLLKVQDCYREHWHTIMNDWKGK